MILHVLIAMVAGWIQRHQQQVITYRQEEHRVLTAQLGGRRLRLTDTERRRLAALAHPLGRKRLKEIAAIATPDTLLRWYKRLIAQKFDGSQQRRPLGRPRVAEEIEQLVMRMAEENPTWGYRRIQGALANLGHAIDAITVRNILRRHHLEPAPQRRKAGMSWPQFLKLHWEVLAATDFFTVEVATWHGLVTYYVLVGDGAGHTARASRGHHAASHRGLYAAMRSAAHRSLRRVPPGETVSDPRPGYQIHASV
jgi:putative transposase